MFINSRFLSAVCVIVTAFFLTSTHAAHHRVRNGINVVFKVMGSMRLKRCSTTLMLFQAL